ncbi:hypothetical protein [Flaviaesturariibacter amylovorans]|uniref:Uncharacterized protein n=1 Tax=Flaviaesturariibacter amylovorans TaxID=1084520 RepID=A0ABP8HFY1_9BACT
MTYDEFQDFIRGKLFLVGLSFYNADRQLLGQYQTSGRVEHLTDTGILVLKRDDDSLFAVPYDDGAIRPAAPGEYTEHSTGKTIVNPDYLLSGDVEVADAAEIEAIRERGFFTA